MVDASLGEIMATREKITWFLSEGERWLKPEYWPTGKSMLHKTAEVGFHLFQNMLIGLDVSICE